MKNKPRLTKKNKAIIWQANELLQPFGCVVTGIGPESVGVLGDARSVGIAIVVKIAPGVDMGEISTMIINRVRGVTRVLMDI